jgi:O-antigen/teichoic acid export membrane protein
MTEPAAAPTIDHVTGGQPRLSLRENFAWTLAGNIVYAGSQWGMLVVLAKLGTPEWVGQFALGLALTAPVLLFANLQLRSVQATDVGGEYRFGHYLALRLLMLALAAIALMVIIPVGSIDLQSALVAAAVAVAKIFEAVSDVYYGLMQKHERMDRIAKSMLLKGPLSLAALATGVYLTGNVAIGVVAMAVVWLAILLFYDRRNGARLLQDTPADLRPHWDRCLLRRLAWLAAPLGVVMMLNSLNVNIPRYVIEHMRGQWELGIFAALAYLQVAEGTIVNALGQSATPRLAEYFAASRRKVFQGLTVRLAGIGLLIGVMGLAVAVLCGRWLLTILYKPEYAPFSGVFVWLMAGAALANIAAFLGYALTAARRFGVQMPLLIGESVVLTASCFVLVPRSGLTGAAIAYLIAKGFLIIVSAVTLIRTTVSDSNRQVSGRWAHAQG